MDPHPTMQQKNVNSDQQENRSSCWNLLNKRRQIEEAATKKNPSFTGKSVEVDNVTEKITGNIHSKPTYQQEIQLEQEYHLCKYNIN